MVPTSETYGSIPGYAILYLLFAIALSLFAYRAYRLYRHLRLGKNESRFDNLGERTKSLVGTILAQRCVLKGVSLKDRAGIGHFFIFWAFILFVINYAILFAVAGWYEKEHLLVLGDTLSSVFSTLLNVIAVVCIIALLWAAYRRYVVKPERLETSLEASIILILIFLLMATHLFDSMGWAEGLGSGFDDANWWAHMVVLLGFLAYIPYSKHLHIVAAPFNVFLRSLRPKGALIPIDIETAETLGVANIEEFTWKQLLDCYACSRCGRCEVSCPAWLSGKPLSPKKLIEDLKVHLLEKGSKEGGRTLIGDVVTEDEIWACTTCRACQEECPVSNEHIDKIIELRRNLVLVASKIPETMERALRTLMRRGDPWTGTLYLRGDWANGLEVKKLSESSDVDILYWVGCAAALDDRSMKIAVSMVRILQAAGVDFAILGAEETCCGEPARRMGHELLFQTLAQQNIETFTRYNVKKILTHCPHCFNSLKNEYPQFGGNFEVVHHTEFVADLIKNGRLTPAKPMNKTLTYHDPCYLGRYNDIYDRPREVLAAIPAGKVELDRSGTKSFCCGGGGGHMWMEETLGRRINELRTDDVIKAKAEMVVTACPFCLQMFEEGIRRKGLEESIRALDLAELVETAI